MVKIQKLNMKEIKIINKIIYIKKINNKIKK